MAVTTNPERINVVIKLDNGTTSTGVKKLVSVAFPAIDKDAFDADKVWAIIVKLRNIFNKSVYRVVKSDESYITG